MEIIKLVVGVVIWFLLSQSVLSLTELVYYESSNSNHTGFATINLSSNDRVENEVVVGVSGITQIVKSVAVFENRGLLIHPSTIFNISGWFESQFGNSMYITWEVYGGNDGEEILLCRSGDNNTGGVNLGGSSKQEMVGNCTYAGNDWLASRNLSLSVNAYNSAGGLKDLSHYWENTSESSISFTASVLGNLSVSLNSSAKNTEEHLAFGELCNVSCSGGMCVNTSVEVQIYNGSDWNPIIATGGNITLNGTQANPVSIGNLSGSSEIEFVLYAEELSENNSIRCFAESAYTSATSSLRNITILDTVPPSVTLVSPEQSQAVPQRGNFSYIAEDAHLANCSLWANWSGGWHLNTTHESPSNGSTEFFTGTTDIGIFLWNVQCTDSSGNTAFAGANRSVLIAGDIEITSMNFSTDSPVEKESITIFVNLTNNGNKTENATIRFWKGPPNDDVQIDENISLKFSPFGKNSTNISYVAELGFQEIYVTVNVSSAEYDLSNNELNKSLSISIWQIYYGNTTGNLTLVGLANESFILWNGSGKKGNIFVTDIDTLNGIDFWSLKPLGKDTSQNSPSQSKDDFENVDFLLNSSGYADSINRTFTSDGEPRFNDSFRVFGNYMNVSAINSTSSGRFTTGILWDSSDSSNEYFDVSDKEDLVFLVSLNSSTPTEYGRVDYIIKVPSLLSKYREGSDRVSFFYEIQ